MISKYLWEWFCKLFKVKRYFKSYYKGSNQYGFILTITHGDYICLRDANKYAISQAEEKVIITKIIELTKHEFEMSKTTIE